MKNAEFRNITTFHVKDEVNEDESLFMGILDDVLNGSVKHVNGEAHVVIEVESEGDLFIVSSICNPLHKETMVFPVIGDDIDYLEAGVSKDFLDFSGALDNAGMHMVNKDDSIAAIESHEDYPILAGFIESNL